MSCHIPDEKIYFRLSHIPFVELSRKVSRLKQTRFTIYFVLSRKFWMRPRYGMNHSLSNIPNSVISRRWKHRWRETMRNSQNRRRAGWPRTNLHIPQTGRTCALKVYMCRGLNSFRTYSTNRGRGGHRPPSCYHPCQYLISYVTQYWFGLTSATYRCVHVRVCCMYVWRWRGESWLAITPSVKGRGQMMPFVLPSKQNYARNAGETSTNDELVKEVTLRESTFSAIFDIPI